jgi:hypothetical protein
MLRGEPDALFITLTLLIVRRRIGSNKPSQCLVKIRRDWNRKGISSRRKMRMGKQLCEHSSRRSLSSL